MSPCALSAAQIEALHRKAGILRNALYGLYQQAKDGDMADAEEDLFPLWELAGHLLVPLRDAHEADLQRGQQAAQGKA